MEKHWTTEPEGGDGTYEGRQTQSKAADDENVPQHASNVGCLMARFVRYAGIVTVRQQPETAKGVVFISLEDVTGNVQVIVWPTLTEKQRAEVLRARLLAVYGQWQLQDGVKNLVGHRLADLTPLLGGSRRRQGIFTRQARGTSDAMQRSLRS
ncbi:hypothetical protein ASF45_32105 [Pseudorhodoferax sp. Leaf265]|nr:hypothetical protein ASF45_32105 [Pseudorhodoferax sp. Leaf265]